MAANPTPAGLTRQPHTILIVEDEVLTRLELADHLRFCGYHVIEAANGAEAMLVLQSEQAIHILFTDVNLPGQLSGFNLAAWVRQNRPQAGVIITSGHDRAAHEVSNFGDDVPYLTKPYDPARLVREIERLLGEV